MTIRRTSTRLRGPHFLALLLVVEGALGAQTASAQPAPQPPPPAAPAPEPPKPQADSIAAALAPKPGGLTPDAAGAAATRTSASVRGKEAELRAAAARV